VAVETGYHEARLYATHLNQNYPTKINPCRFILATNGKRFMAGYWDSPPELEGNVSDLQPQTKVMEELRRLCSRQALESHALECLKAYSSKRSFLPFNLAGGPALLRAVNKPNRFAAPLAPLLQRYFSSSQQSSVEEIVERAYVSSDEVTEYDRILESLLKERSSARHGMSVEYLHPERTGELDDFQKYRAVDTFYRYLWNAREAARTPFSQESESGADYVLKHMRDALRRAKYPSKNKPSEEDPLDS
jgi:hypothetical protein